LDARIVPPLQCEGELMSDANVATKGADEKFCHECGAVIRAKAEICPKCGVRQTPATAAGLGVTPSGKSKIAAALFAIFLGGIGIHKFYLGRVVWGILYILFCWTFIPAIVGFIEGIVYLTMSDEAFAQKYG
jgi:TM2 domain-containing membrane protein YozV